MLGRFLTAVSSWQLFGLVVRYNKLHMRREDVGASRAGLSNRHSA